MSKYGPSQSNRVHVDGDAATAGAASNSIQFSCRTETEIACSSFLCPLFALLIYTAIGYVQFAFRYNDDETISRPRRGC